MKFLIQALITALLPVLVVAQTPISVQEGIPTTESVWYEHGRHVARTSTGTVVVAWTNDVVARNGQIVYSTFDEAFQTWSPPVAISSAGDHAHKSSIGADGVGNVHATWQQKTMSTDKYQIWYSKFNGASWSAPVKISGQDADNCEEANIVVDSRDYVYIAYNNDTAGPGNEWIFARRSTDGGTTWGAFDTVSASGNITISTTVARPAMSAGSNGRIAAIWHEASPFNSARREIFANLYDGNSWLGAEMISDSTTVGRIENWYPTIAFGEGDSVVAIYHTNEGGSNYRYMFSQRRTWAGPWHLPPTGIVDSNNVTDYLAVSASGDPDGRIHVVYRAPVPDDTLGLTQVNYSRSDDGGATWSTPIRLSRERVDAEYCSIAHRINPAFGVDVVWRERLHPNVTAGDSSNVVYANVPYNLTSVGESENIPVAYDLVTNYPNPFNPSTTIFFNLAAKGTVRLAIYDALGREVASLVNDVMESGAHRVVWDGRSGAGAHLSSGLYFARLMTARGSTLTKMMLLK